MNLQIRKLSLAMLLLFGVLVAGTSWWTVVKAKSTADNPLNRRPLLEQQQIPRGLILARNGTRLAVNKRQGSGVGLTLARQITTLHGGMVTIAETRGGGATVSLRF